MLKDYIVYAISILVIIISFTAIQFLPIPEQYKGAFSLTGVIALFSLLAQARRDQRAYERELEFQSRQQDFTLGIASHMANVTFDRLVEFCESYFGAAYEILQSLFRDGPTPNSLTHAKNLISIRLGFSPWFPRSVENGLLPFEKALSSIAADAMLTESLPVSPSRSEAVHRMYGTFSDIIRLEPLPDGSEPDEAIIRIIEHLREVLRIHELTVLRDYSIKTAFNRISESEDE